MMSLYEEIKALEAAYPDVLFGISGTGFSNFEEGYKCALVVAVPHSRRMTLEQYREDEYERLIREARERSVGIINETAAILEQLAIPYSIPKPGQTSEEELVALLSYKYAAVNAGLGWIGKNDILITEKYGPQVSLYAILIKADLPVGEPFEQSKCPPRCDLCRRACPCNALPGIQWSMESKRSDLIDYQLCNRERSSDKEALGRKHACGLCMVACPNGRYTCLR